MTFSMRAAGSGEFGERTYRLVPLKQDHSSTLVTRSQVISGVVEFDGRDDIR